MRSSKRVTSTLNPPTVEGCTNTSPVGPAKSNASERGHLAAFCVFARGSQLPLHRALHQFGALFLHRHAEHGAREGDRAFDGAAAGVAHAEVGADAESRDELVPCVAPAGLRSHTETQPFILRTIAVTSRRGEMRTDCARSLFFMPGTTTRAPRFIAS